MSKHDSMHKAAEWFKTPLGEALSYAERERLATTIPQLYSPVAIQVERINGLKTLELTEAATQVVIGGRSGWINDSAPDVISDTCALPFGERSADLVVLPHTLEFCEDSHQLLREVAAIIVPNGHLVVIGFNPMSLWGLWRGVYRWSGRAPWCGDFIRLSRVQDWLALLGFEVASGSLLYYRPPFFRARLQERLRFVELSGARWWPALAAVYIVLARKRELGISSVRQAHTKRKRLTPQLARITHR